MTKRVLLFEYATGGGAWEDASLLDDDCPFLEEGALMLQALLGDLTALAGVEVELLWDERLSPSLLGEAARKTHIRTLSSAAQWQTAIEDAAQSCTDSLFVAPECGGVLRRIADRVARTGLRLACPQDACVRLASDKQSTAEWLLQAGIPCPAGIRLEPGERLPADFPYPAVLKPVDGAGAMGLRTIANSSCMTKCPPGEADWRLESFVEGRSASVLLLSYDEQGEPRVVALPPAWQRIASGDAWSYLGGESPIARDYAERATRLALRTAAALPPWRGLLGVDLVLGMGHSADVDESHAGDWVIEVNPRVTTSYVGVRQILRGNALSLLFSDHADATCVQARTGTPVVRWTTGELNVERRSALQ